MKKKDSNYTSHSDIEKFVICSKTIPSQKLNKTHEQSKKEILTKQDKCFISDFAVTWKSVTMLFTVHLLFNTLLSQKKSMFVVKPAAFFRCSNAHVPSRHLQQHVTNHTPLKNPPVHISSLSKLCTLSVCKFMYFYYKKLIPN